LYRYTLDLRFDVTRGEPASAFLQRVSRDELITILETYGETTDPTAARRVADAVCVARDEGRLPSRTKEFAALVDAAKGKEYQAMHPAKLTFQALRVHLNQEFDEMKRGMRAAVEVMPEGGRLGVLTVRRHYFFTSVNHVRRHPLFMSPQKPRPPLQSPLPFFSFLFPRPAAAGRAATQHTFRFFRCE
jgi:hypothetical protein